MEFWVGRWENDTYPDFVWWDYYVLLIDIVIKSWFWDKGNCTFIISNWHMWVSIFYFLFGWTDESPAGGSGCVSRVGFVVFYISRDSLLVMWSCHVSCLLSCCCSVSTGVSYQPRPLVILIGLFVCVFKPLCFSCCLSVVV